jgi:hypothetical protein
MKKSIMTFLKIDGTKSENQALQHHDLFKCLAGNPLAIKMLASFHRNPLMQNNDLLSLYEKVRSDQ